MMRHDSAPVIDHVPPPQNEAPDADVHNNSPELLLRTLAADKTLQLRDHHNSITYTYSHAEAETAFQATYVRPIFTSCMVLNAAVLQTQRRINCVIYLNLWCGLDNLMAGIIDYSGAGVGVLAVLLLSPAFPSAG